MGESVRGPVRSQQETDLLNRSSKKIKRGSTGELIHHLGDGDVVMESCFTRAKQAIPEPQNQ